MLLLGFSCGIPLGLTGGTFQAWMTDAKVPLSIIGLAALVGTPYTLKYLWSPILDRYVPPFMGRRRGWMIIFQLGLIACIAAMAFWTPPPSDMELALPASFSGVIEWEKTAGFFAKNFLIGPIKFVFGLPLLFQFFFLPLLVAFFSASQDIVVDAYRTELVPAEERGISAGLYIMGYRLAMLVSGALALIMADHLPWKTVYLVMAATMIIGVLCTLFAPEPKVQAPPPKSLGEAIVMPFVEYLKRKGAYEILLFVLLFKLGDVLAGMMTTPFMMSLGFTKTDIGAVNKGMGLICTIAGGLFGGVMMARFGTLKSLWVFGILQAGSNLMFMVLAIMGHDYPTMVAAIGIENLAGGMGTAAYSAFLMALCNQRFTATQYALMTSLMASARVFIGSLSGIMAENMGWQTYFLMTTIAAAPGLLLLLRYRHWTAESEGLRT